MELTGQDSRQRGLEETGRATSGMPEPEPGSRDPRRHMRYGRPWFRHHDAGLLRVNLRKTQNLSW
jgi:hypothetical protein